MPMKRFKDCFYCVHSDTMDYISPCNECTRVGGENNYPTEFIVKTDDPDSCESSELTAAQYCDAATGSSLSGQMDMGQCDPNGKGQHEAGAKNDFGKTRWSLLPWKIIEDVANVMTFGAAKYTDNGWKSVPQAKERYFSAMLRHKMLMDAGEYRDPESGLPHWAHFCCNAIFLGFFYRK